jgi:2-polyprenyl-3-methyl-5-hydroxy-6-metoxy-1,4-benzoquinol methylase
VSSPPTSHVERVHRLFDDKAEDWPGHYRPDGALLGRLFQVTGAVEELTSAGAPVLDLGCGSGELTRRLACSGFQLTGCDVSENMLRQARRADPRSAVSWVQINPAWQRLPFGDDRFATVVAASVLEYLESPATVFAECARILRPGGTLVVTVPNLAHPVRWLEGIGQLAAGTAPVRRLAAGSGRLDAYLTYLRISRNRHGSRWWETVAGQAGLAPVPLAAMAAGRPTLRLLAFRAGPEGPPDGAER